MTSQIAIVFGAGKNIGVSTVQAFQSKGFKVARVSRSAGEESSDGLLSIPCDLTQPSQVHDVFARVRKTWGEPNVIIYNAYGMHVTGRADSFSVSVEDFATDLAVNTISVFAAIREAANGFQSLPSGSPKTFIYTGNILNEGPVPRLLTLGTGKAATAHMIALGDQLYRDLNARFFYVDERQADGTPIFADVGAQAHADIFLSLADRTMTDVPWQITFVAGKGYVEFPHKVLMPEGKL